MGKDLKISVRDIIVTNNKPPIGGHPCILNFLEIEGENPIFEKQFKRHKNSCAFSKKKKKKDKIQIIICQPTEKNKRNRYITLNNIKHRYDVHSSLY